MTTFQFLADFGLAGLLLWDLVAVTRGRGAFWQRLLRMLVWLGAAAAITWPNLVQQVAELLGIGRGADVVLYLFVLVFLGTAFFLYSRQVKLEQDLTQVVRHIALREAASELHLSRGSQGIASGGHREGLLPEVLRETGPVETTRSTVSMGSRVRESDSDR